MKEESPINRAFPDDLRRRMEITTGVRFKTAERLQKKHQLSVLAINILSLCVISFELISILAKTKTHSMELLFPIATIITPIFIIVLAAHENAKQYLVYADRMHRSAQRISQLSSELKFKIHADQLTLENLDELRKSYDSVLYESLINHDDVDYKYYQSLHPEPFLEKKDTRWQRFKLFIKGRLPYYFNVWGLPITVIIIPLGLLLLSLWLLINTP